MYYVYVTAPVNKLTAPGKAAVLGVEGGALRLGPVMIPVNSGKWIGNALYYRNRHLLNSLVKRELVTVDGAPDTSGTAEPPVPVVEAPVPAVTAVPDPVVKPVVDEPPVVKPPVKAPAVEPAPVAPATEEPEVETAESTSWKKWKKTKKEKALDETGVE